MQLEEKRRHIEAEKLRKQAQQEEEWRQMRQTAFLYVVGKGRAERQSKVPQAREETQGVSEVSFSFRSIINKCSIISSAAKILNIDLLKTSF